MNFNFGFATDIGRKRTQNQDSVTVHPELGLFVVADGMGGHRGGETASAMAVEIVPQVVRQAQKVASWNPRETVAHSIRVANNSIFDRAAHQAQLQGMGTTLITLLFKDNRLTIGHVGDSRCYFFRSGAVWQATRDHSLVQEKLRAGLITRPEVKTDRMKNVITRSVGFEPDVNVEVYEMDVKPGDTFLICSDGLSGLMDDDCMLEVVQRKHFVEHDIQSAVKELIQTANQNGGDDNITTVMVEVI